MTILPDSRRLAQWRSLSSTQRGALVRALVLLPGIALALRCLGYRRTVLLVQGGAPGAPDASLPAEQVRELEATSRMIAVASNHGIHRGNCLTKSLTLLCLMRRAGRRGRLVLGARKEEGRFGAHAWVECGGIVINDDAQVGERYSAFGESAARHPTSGPRRTKTMGSRGCGPRHGEVYE